MHTTNTEDSTNPEDNANTEQQLPESNKPGLFTVLFSVLAALFGVQTEANRKRDFSSGNPLAYIIVFIMLLILFVLTIAGIVTLVLR